MWLPENSNQTLLNSPSLFSLFGSLLVAQKQRKRVMHLSSAGVSFVRALWSGLVVLSQSVILGRRFIQDKQSQK